MSRHGITYDAFIRWVPPCVVVGAVELAVIGLVGVRRVEDDRPSYTPTGRRGAPLLTIVALPFALMGGLLGLVLGDDMSAGFIGFAAGVLVCLPFGLRLVGLR